jgi:hypothetical protein
MWVVNFANVKYVTINGGDEGTVNIHFVDGTDIPFFGKDAIRIRALVARFTSNRRDWNVVTVKEE